MTYKPFGYDVIPAHLQGYRILAQHIAIEFPRETWTDKAKMRRKYRLAAKDFTYSDYNGPFK